MATSLQASADVRALQAVCQTVRGASHKRQGKACQDSSCKDGEAGAVWRIAVVSDGHGESSCVRSDRGSRFATAVARDCLREFAEAASKEWGRGESPYENLLVPARQAMVVRRLTDAIVMRWHRAVLKDIADEPLREEELSQASGALADYYRRGERLEHGYGATLVGALWMEDVLVLLQQGDGVCLVMHEDGSFEEPVPEDPNCYGNVTSSLCDVDVADAIRHSVLLIKDDSIRACVLATDGVANSVAGDKGVVCFAKELLRDLSVAESVEAFEKYLLGRLDTLSENGNGDDVSVALLADVSAVQALSERFSRDLDAWQGKVQAAALKEKLVSMERKHTILAERAENARGERDRLESRLSSLKVMRDRVRSLEVKRDVLGKLEAEMSAWVPDPHIAQAIFEWVSRDEWRVIEDLFPSGFATPFEVAKAANAVERRLRKEVATADRLDKEVRKTEDRLHRFDSSDIEEYAEYDGMRQELLDELAEIEAADADIAAGGDNAYRHVE